MGVFSGKLPKPSPYTLALFLTPRQPSQDFLLIVPEELKLPKKDRNDQDDDLVAKNEDSQPYQCLPDPGRLVCEPYPGGYGAGDPGGEGSGDGKGAEDEEELGAVNLPLGLKFLEHRQQG